MLCDQYSEVAVLVKGKERKACRNYDIKQIGVCNEGIHAICPYYLSKIDASEFLDFADEFGLKIISIIKPVIKKGIK